MNEIKRFGHCTIWYKSKSDLRQPKYYIYLSKGNPDTLHTPYRLNKKVTDDDTSPVGYVYSYTNSVTDDVYTYSYRH